MPWLGYSLGLVVGGCFGFWLHDFWEGDLTGIGSPPPPSFDLYVPLTLFIVAVVTLRVLGKRGQRAPGGESSS